MTQVLAYAVLVVVVAAAFGVVYVLRSRHAGRWLNGRVTRHPVVATVVVLAGAFGVQHYLLG